jgi:hypothetical protein
MLQEHCRFIVDVCSGAPVALSVVCNLLRYGHCDAAEFVRLYTDPRLPLDRSLSNTSTGTSFLPFESRATNERLQRYVLAGTGVDGWHLSTPLRLHRQRCCLTCAAKFTLFELTLSGVSECG